MKLFFDENLSPRLVEIFENKYPGSTHVRIEKFVKQEDSALLILAHR